MTRILLEHVAQAHQRVGRLDFSQKERLADDIFRIQPNFLASVLALNKLGVSHEHMEPLLHILFMSLEAVRCARLRLPMITEAVQERCLARVVGRSRFIEGLSPRLADQVVHQQIENHPEKFLLALVVNELREHGFDSVRSEEEKYCMLAALNLVEVIAYAAKDARPEDPT